MYGSSLMLVTRMMRDSRIAAREAAAMPFPREETTPPVTKTYLVIYPARVGMEEFTGTRPAPQMGECAMRSADARPIVVTVLNEGERLAVGLTDLRSAGQIARVDSAPALLAEVRRRAADAPAHELGAAVLALLPEPVREFLAASPARFLVLQLDEELTDIPWEMAYDGASFLGEKFALARQVVSGPAGAALVPARPARDALKVLVADAEAAPQGPAAADSVAQRLAAIDGLSVTTVHVGDITRAGALKLIAEHDVVHYAGPASRAAAGDVAWWRG